ncbi:hypothetical protein [Sediminibacillus albus]|uniref:Uncharacterized protein n=1 Tax=Sediminibacillus albus TaxID=407036 RepID=A0A1G9BXW5_9BACI|nr:hypothetical protein [Sediminibacillus albus]SDK44298.1 hypothetical protein SAMN05216243_3196 [Sediminibacillus albus]
MLTYRTEEQEAVKPVGEVAGHKEKRTRPGSGEGAGRHRRR